MGSKHDLLTENELSSYRLNSHLVAQIEGLRQRFPEAQPQDINILDWGCGRGRSVAKLREQGFNAFGVDIDLKTMANGFPLFEQRGFTPTDILRSVHKVDTFENNFFHLIFSEQVFEHVANLSEVLSEQARLTTPKGIGIHYFPGSRNVWEGHLHMPLVHWLPKAPIRKYWISAMLLLSYGPKPAWPETRATSFSESVEVYYRYMNEHTYYRDNNAIQQAFRKHGFGAYYQIIGMKTRWTQLLPASIRKNGFRERVIIQ